MPGELVNKIIGDKISKMRHTIGFTQEELGRTLGISCEQVQKYESGVNDIPPADLVKLARLFRCSIDYLCGFEALSAFGAVVDNADFLDRSDFKKTQALIRHFITIEHPILRNVAYNVVRHIASLQSHDVDSLPEASREKE